MGKKGTQMNFFLSEETKRNFGFFSYRVIISLFCFFVGK